MAANHLLVRGKKLPQWDNKMSSLCIEEMHMPGEQREVWKNHKIEWGVQWYPEFRQCSVPAYALGGGGREQHPGALLCWWCMLPSKAKTEHTNGGENTWEILLPFHSATWFFFFFFSVTLTNILILQIKLKLLNDAFYLKDVSFPLMLLACSSQVWISKMFFSFPTMKWWRSRVTWCLCVCKVVCECMTERKNRAGRKKKQGNPEWEQNQIWKEIQFSNDISIIFNQI